MKVKKCFFLMIFLLVLPSFTDSYPMGKDSYKKDFEKIETKNDISDCFTIKEELVKVTRHKKMGFIQVIPAINKLYKRTAIFFVKDDKVVYKIDKLEVNQVIDDSVVQVSKETLGISFEDLNNDGLLDIILISSCENRLYNNFLLADILFQSKDDYYRDYRISDKLNRFDMNKNISTVRDFIIGQKSTEYLYRSTNFDDILKNDFAMIENQSFQINLEKFGLVDFISGFYEMSGQNYLMMFLVDDDKNILWNFQPMSDYLNFVKIKGLSFTDLNGDGLKDVVLIAEYVEPKNGEIVCDYNIYYQRAGFFEEDIAIKDKYKCSIDDNLSSIITIVRTYLGRDYID